MTRVEVAAREVRITNQRIRSSGFPYVKGLADFDWDFQPSVPRAEIEELATLRFVERAENCVSSRVFEQKEHRKLSSLSIESAHAF